MQWNEKIMLAASLWYEVTLFLPTFVPVRPWSVFTAPLRLVNTSALPQNQCRKSDRAFSWNWRTASSATKTRQSWIIFGLRAFHIEAKGIISPLQAFYYKLRENIRSQISDGRNTLENTWFILKSGLKLGLIESVSEPVIQPAWLRHCAGQLVAGNIIPSCRAEVWRFDSSEWTQVIWQPSSGWTDGHRE